MYVFDESFPQLGSLMCESVTHWFSIDYYANKEVTLSVGEVQKEISLVITFKFSLDGEVQMHFGDADNSIWSVPSLPNELWNKLIQARLLNDRKAYEEAIIPLLDQIAEFCDEFNEGLRYLIQPKMHVKGPYSASRADLQ